MTYQPTSLEKHNLEAHVDMCAMRSAQIHRRLSLAEADINGIHDDIVAGQKSLHKALIGTSGSIVAGIISLVATLVMQAE